MKNLKQIKQNNLKQVPKSELKAIVGGVKTASKWIVIDNIDGF